METVVKHEGKIGDNQFIVKGTESILSILVVNPKKLIKYSKELSNCQGVTINPPNFISTLPQLLAALQYALSSANTEGTVTLQEDSGNLTLQTCAFGVQVLIIVKLDNFSPSDDEKIEFMMKLQEKQLKCEENFSSTLNPANQNDFTFSEDFKTVTMKTTGWKGVVGNTRFSGLGKKRYSVKIAKMSPAKNIMIGVATQDTNLIGGAYAKAGCFMFHCANGHIYINATARAFVDATRISILQGDTITVTLDMDSSMLSFDVNGVSLGIAARLNLTLEQLCKLYPAIDLQTAGDSVTFL
jgi:hypothetical protein